MKKKAGDIVLSFKNRVIYLLETELLDIRDVISTEQEATIFKDAFLSKNIKAASFSDFKKIMPYFDARSHNNRNYGHIEITEQLFLMLRELKNSEPFKNTRYSFPDIVYTLIQKQLYNKIALSSKVNNEKAMQAIEAIRENLTKLEGLI